MADETGALAAALAKAQASFPAIPRDKEVTVQLKTGGSYKFKYAPLESILNATRGPLSDNGLALAQLLDSDADGAPALVTMLLHSEGGQITGRTPIPATEGNVQAFGSAITYLRRYAIQALLGIAAEEDDDGNAASGNRATFKERTPTPPPDPEKALTRADQPELIGPWSDTGAIGINKRGTADGLLRQDPDGAYVIVSFTTVSEHKVPQVVFRGSLAVDVLDAAGSLLNGLVGTIEGTMYRVTYFVGEQKIPKVVERLEATRIVTAGWTLPFDEAPSVPMFSEDEDAALDLALG